MSGTTLFNNLLEHCQLNDEQNAKMQLTDNIDTLDQSQLDTLLDQAIGFGSSEVVSMFLEFPQFRTDQIEESLLLATIKEGHFRIVKRLIQIPTFELPFFASMALAALGHVDLVQDLLAHPSHEVEREVLVEAILKMGIEKGFVEMTRMVLASEELDVQVSEEHLSLAIKMRNLEMVRVLVNDASLDITVRSILLAEKLNENEILSVLKNCDQVNGSMFGTAETIFTTHIPLSRFDNTINEILQESSKKPRKRKFLETLDLQIFLANFDDRHERIRHKLYLPHKLNQSTKILILATPQEIENNEHLKSDVSWLTEQELEEIIAENNKLREKFNKKTSVFYSPRFPIHQFEDRLSRYLHKIEAISYTLDEKFNLEELEKVALSRVQLTTKNLTRVHVEKEENPNMTQIEKDKESHRLNEKQFGNHINCRFADIRLSKDQIRENFIHLMYELYTVLHNYPKIWDNITHIVTKSTMGKPKFLYYCTDYEAIQNKKPTF